jgi:hypothetical protein
LPYFIWFDATMLQFTHLVGLVESITYGPGNHETTRLQMSDPEYTVNPYDLLIGSKDKRLNIIANALAECKRSHAGYNDLSVRQLAQHCILFAPEFDRAISQPPVSTVEQV